MTTFVLISPQYPLFTHEAPVLSTAEHFTDFNPFEEHPPQKKVLYKQQFLFMNDFK